MTRPCAKGLLLLCMLFSIPSPAHAQDQPSSPVSPKLLPGLTFSVGVGLASFGSSINHGNLDTFRRSRTPVVSGSVEVAMNRFLRVQGEVFTWREETSVWVRGFDAHRPAGDRVHRRLGVRPQQSLHRNDRQRHRQPRFRAVPREHRRWRRSRDGAPEGLRGRRGVRAARRGRVRRRGVFVRPMVHHVNLAVPGRCRCCSDAPDDRVRECSSRRVRELQHDHDGWRSLEAAMIVPSRALICWLKVRFLPGSPAFALTPSTTYSPADSRSQSRYRTALPNTASTRVRHELTTW